MTMNHREACLSVSGNCSRDSCSHALYSHLEEIYCIEGNIFQLRAVLEHHHDYSKSLENAGYQLIWKADLDPALEILSSKSKWNMPEVEIKINTNICSVRGAQSSCVYCLVFPELDPDRPFKLTDIQCSPRTLL